MRSFRTRALMGGTAVLALAAFTNPAAAQSENPTTTGAVAAGEARAADAPAVASAPTGEDEIVVTAQFRTERLQDTPLAITAMSSEMLTARSFNSIADVGRAAPSVTLRQASSGYGKSTQAYIRGIGQTDFNFALEPAVGFYVDDVYHASLFGTSFDLLDLERVEILRGPQGTLFGKNSLGGAVRLISKKPDSNDTSAMVEGTYGSFARIDLRGMVNLPIVEDILAVRISAASKQRNGYVDRVDFACAYPAQAGRLVPTVSSNGNSCKVGTLGGENVRAGRVALRWTPSSTVELNLTAEIIRDNSEGAADSLIAVNTNAAALVTYNNNRLIPTYGIPFDSRFIVDPYTTFANYESAFLGRRVPAVNTVHSNSYSGDLTWDLAEDVQLRLITAYQEFNGRFTQNANNSPLPVALTDNIAGFKQFTQEARLTGQALDSRFEWAAGGFYFTGKSSLGGGAYLAASNIGFDQNESTKARNQSLFAHGVFHMTDDLSVTGGIRYSDEWKYYNFNRTNVPAGTAFFPGGAFRSPKTKFDRFDYKLGLDYKITPDVMVYGQYSTGFKGGGINPRPFTPAAAVPFGPETLKSYEVGFKSEFFDRLVRLNVAGYHSDYSNLQLSANGFDNNGAPSIIIANVGSADIRGIEAELQLRPSRDFLIDATASLTDFEIKSLGAAAGVSGGPTLNSKAPGTPKWKANVGMQYTASLGDAGTLTPRVDYYYQSRMFNEVTNNPIAAEPGYGIVNARLTYSTNDENWSLAAGVTNLFDKFYYVNRFIQAGSYIFTGQPSRPREWYVTATKRF